MTDSKEVVKIVPQFPSLFKSSIWDNFWKDWEDFDNILLDKGSAPCDIAEVKDDDGVVIANEFSYALAGYEKGNVNVEVDDNRLTIAVDKSEEIEDEDENKTYLHKGLTHKKMQWSYTLGNKIDADGVLASMDNGVLKVTVPLLPEKGKKKIEVQ